MYWDHTNHFLSADDHKLSDFLAQPVRQYTGWAQRTAKLCTVMTDRLMKVGQMQILRLHAANRLNASCKFDAKYLAAALTTMNE